MGMCCDTKYDSIPGSEYEAYLDGLALEFENLSDGRSKEEMVKWIDLNMPDCKTKESILKNVRLPTISINGHFCRKEGEIGTFYLRLYDKRYSKCYLRHITIGPRS